MQTTSVKDLLNDSSLASHAYSGWLRLRARWHSVRGDTLSAAELLMRSWRAIGQPADGPGVSQARRLIARECFRGAHLRPISANGLLRAFQGGDEARAIRKRFASYSSDDQVRLRFPSESEEDDPERQGDLIILKAPDADTGEKGVILITYTEAIRRFAAMFDLDGVGSNYMLVHEPSWWGYSDLTFLLYLGSDLDVLVQSPWPTDYDFIQGLQTNLEPTRIGAGDWIDPRTFRPQRRGHRTYDLVMVSAWSPVKRHRELFRMLAKLRREKNITLKTALIGYPGGWTRGDIERMMDRYGVADSCTIYESIPHARVAEIVADSRAYLLLSRREGANRALYEALFCDTPVIVYRGHRGVNLDHITHDIGVNFEDGKLDQAVLRILETPERFKPREWALAHTGWDNATTKIEGELREMAARRGFPWTRGIAAKMMAPNLRYAEPGRYLQFEADYRALAQHLLPAH